MRPRRTSKIFCTVVAVALFAATVNQVAAQGPAIRVTLLGTGCPPPVMNRFGPSTLVEAGDQKFLFDAGRGALQRLTQLNVRWGDVRGVFLTHLHSDHVVGFPDLWLTGWLIAPGRDVPLQVWGPRGTSRMMSHLKQAYEYDIRVRLYNDRAARDGVVLRVKDIVEGVVYDQGGVKVTAFEVDHARVKPAFGYRIDYAGRSVVLSGDTRVSENLIRLRPGSGCVGPRSVRARDSATAGPAARAREEYHCLSHDPTAGRGSVYASETETSGVFAHLHAERHRSGTAFADAQDLCGAVGARRGFDGDRSGRED